MIIDDNRGVWFTTRRRGGFWPANWKGWSWTVAGLLALALTWSGLVFPRNEIGENIAVSLLVAAIFLFVCWRTSDAGASPPSAGR